jgi:hypothetical protein
LLEDPGLKPISRASDFVRDELTRRMCVERRIRSAHANDIAASINDTTAPGEWFCSRRYGNCRAARRVVEGRGQWQEQPALSRTRLVQVKLRIIVQDHLAAQNLAACGVDDYEPGSMGHGVVRPVCAEELLGSCRLRETKIKQLAV